MKFPILFLALLISVTSVIGDWYSIIKEYYSRKRNIINGIKLTENGFYGEKYYYPIVINVIGEKYHCPWPGVWLSSADANSRLSTIRRVRNWHMCGFYCKLTPGYNYWS